MASGCLTKPYCVNYVHMEVGYGSEEFTSAFETREKTAKSHPIHGFRQRPEGHTPPEYIGDSSSP